MKWARVLSFVRSHNVIKGPDTTVVGANKAWIVQHAFGKMPGLVAYTHGQRQGILHLVVEHQQLLPNVIVFRKRETEQQVNAQKGVQGTHGFLDTHIGSGLHTLSHHHLEQINRSIERSGFLVRIRDDRRRSSLLSLVAVLTRKTEPYTLATSHRLGGRHGVPYEPDEFCPNENGLGQSVGLGQGQRDCENRARPGQTRPGVGEVEVCVVEFRGYGKSSRVVTSRDPQP